MPALRHYRIFSWLARIVLIGLLAACGSSPTTTGTQLAIVGWTTV